MIAEAIAPVPLAVPAPTVASAPPVTPDLPPMPKITVQQYLEMERRSKIRHEYVDGKVIAMAGESLAHNRIARNIVVKLETNFADNTCETFMENIRVRVTPTRYRYPNVVALCGEAQIDDTNPPALLNPAVIFEVASPSTENEDRDEKWTEYQQLPSVTDYILVAQNVVQVIHYVRVSDTHWTITIYREMQDALTLASLNTSLPLADIYRKIVLPAVEAPAAAAG